MTGVWATCDIMNFNRTKPSNFARDPELCLFDKTSKNLPYIKLLQGFSFNIDFCVHFCSTMEYFFENRKTIEQKHMKRSNVGLKIGMDGMCDAKPATWKITKIDRYR